jgi:hypothetical protein
MFSSSYDALNALGGSLLVSGAGIYYSASKLWDKETEKIKLLYENVRNKHRDSILNRINTEINSLEEEMKSVYSDFCRSNRDEKHWNNYQEKLNLFRERTRELEGYKIWPNRIAPFPKYESFTSNNKILKDTYRIMSASQKGMLIVAGILVGNYWFNKHNKQ